MNIEELLKNTGGILTGHFLLTSGKHSDKYFEKFRLIENASVLEELVTFMVYFFKEYPADYIVGPTTGGAIIAYEVARQMNMKFLIAEKRDNERVFARGVIPQTGDRCIVVDDVLTTGGSFNDTVNAVLKTGAIVVAGSVLIDRSAEFIPDFPYKPLYKTEAVVYEPDDCPLCRENIPLVRPGGKR